MTNATNKPAQVPKTDTCSRPDHCPAPERLSASAGGLVEQRYSQALHRHLEGMPAKEIGFFINSKRLEMIEHLAGQELRRRGSEILNVACGPFALEFYLQLRGAHITSFDREPRLAGLHGELLSSGLISDSEFHVTDVHEFAAAKRFDAVIINDLFYTKHIDFYALIGKYAGYVKPSGLLYFDIQDERAGPLWRAFGKDAEYRRYDLARVSRTLNECGLDVTSVTPALGIKGGLDRVLRKGLWYTAGLANSFIFVARKT
jgi:SAM-dependent methyltransferase